jgi:hypothetical protein
MALVGLADEVHLIGVRLHDLRFTSFIWPHRLPCMVKIVPNSATLFTFAGAQFGAERLDDVDQRHFGVRLDLV